MYFTFNFFSVVAFRVHAHRLFIRWEKERLRACAVPQVVDHFLLSHPAPSDM